VQAALDPQKVPHRHLMGSLAHGVRHCRVTLLYYTKFLLYYYYTWCCNLILGLEEIVLNDRSATPNVSRTGTLF
jgi:hypothetical protein